MEEEESERGSGMTALRSTDEDDVEEDDDEERGRDSMASVRGGGSNRGSRSIIARWRAEMAVVSRQEFERVGREGSR